LLFFAANYQPSRSRFPRNREPLTIQRTKNTKSQLSATFFHCEGGNFTALFDEICMAAMIPQG
jgi:hypothetical protein